MSLTRFHCAMSRYLFLCSTWAKKILVFFLVGSTRAKKTDILILISSSVREEAKQSKYSTEAYHALIAQTENPTPSS